MKKLTPFAENLRRIRKEKGESQRDTAKKTGLGHLNVARYERGESIPRIDIAAKLAEHLNVSLDELCRNTKSKTADIEILAKRCSKLPKNKIRAIEIIISAMIK